MIWVTLIIALLGLLMEWLLARPNEPLGGRDRERLNRLIARMEDVRREAVRQGCVSVGQPIIMPSTDDEIRQELIAGLDRLLTAPNLIVDRGTKALLRIVLEMAGAKDPALMAVIEKVRKELEEP